MTPYGAKIWCLMAPSHYLSQCWLIHVMEIHVIDMSLKIFNLLLQPHLSGPNKLNFRRAETLLYYNDVTWTSYSLKSFVIRMVVKQLMHTHIKETSIYVLLALCEGIHQWLVNSLHKGPVMWKKLPCDDIMMALCVALCSISQQICAWFCLALCHCGIIWSIYPYFSGLLQWHWGNHMIAPVPLK